METPAQHSTPTVTPAIEHDKSATPHIPLRGMWAAIIMIAAVITGCAAGLLSWWGGATPPNAVLAGAAAFGAATVFGFAVFEFLHR